MNLHKSISLLGVSLLCSLGTSQADENLWTYTRGTDTRPQGTWELKLSDIWRTGKDSGYYHFHDIRPEVEYGLTDRLTLGAEVMFFYHDYSVDSPDLDPMYTTQGGEGGQFEEFNIGGFELFAKYNVLSPYKDPVGLSFGLGWEYRDHYRLDGSDIEQNTLYAAIFLQKNYLDDRLTLAFNGKMELENRRGPGVREEEIAFDLSAGIAYRFAPKWFVGLETRWQSDFLSPESLEDPVGFEEGVDRSSWDLDDIRLGTQYQEGLYFGPSIHYSEQDWWVTGGLLFQVYGNGGYSTEQKNWDEHEKVHASLTVGFNF